MSGGDIFIDEKSIYVTLTIFNNVINTTGFLLATSANRFLPNYYLKLC